MTTDITENFMQDLAESAGITADQLPDFRANVPVGEVIGESSSAPGHTTQWKKPSSRMRMGDKELPDRVKLYDRLTGDTSMVPPTIALARYQRDPSRFTTKRPADWKEPVPIDDTCLVCLKNPERRGIPKPFYDEDKLIGHYRAFHPAEWETMERKRDRDERRASDQRMEALIATIATLASPGIRLPEDVQEQITTLQSKAAKVCPECGEEVPVANFQYARHMKGHKEK